MKTCYYEVLGVEKHAGQSEIKGAYRKAALEFHPDRNSSPEAEGKFKEASEAYEVLSDQHKRSIYDQYGHAGLENGGMGGGFSSANDIFSSFSDIFEDFFGFGGSSRGQRRGPQSGADLRYDLEISFMESFEGCEHKIEYTREEPCELCEGKGYPPEVKPYSCRTCGGRGQVMKSQGFFAVSSTCPQCRGKGIQVDKQCEDCRGQSVIRKNKKVKVKIPAGVDNEMRLRIAGEGNGGDFGAPFGDLYVFVYVKPDENYQRQGNDLHMACEVSMIEACLGREHHLTGPAGDLSVEIPAGTQTGDQIRLSGKGMPKVNKKGAGDLVLTCIVLIPKKLNKEQKKLLEDFEKSEPSFKSKPKKKGLFG